MLVAAAEPLGTLQPLPQPSSAIPRAGKQNTILWAEQPVLEQEYDAALDEMDRILPFADGCEYTDLLTKANGNFLPEGRPSRSPGRM